MNGTDREMNKMPVGQIYIAVRAADIIAHYARQGWGKSPNNNNETSGICCPRRNIKGLGAPAHGSILLRLLKKLVINVVVH